MLSGCLIVPLVGAVVLWLGPWRSPQAVRALGAAFAALPLGLLAIVWLRFDPDGPLFQMLTDLPWIAALGAGYRLGVDGIALPVASVSALLFVIAVLYPVDHRGRAASYVAWLLFLEAVSLGLFLTLDLLMFYVCFDLSLVGMYFLVAIWGHADRERAALQFILYTLAGSLVMLLGILSLVLAHDPLTFDMRVLIADQPLAGAGPRATLSGLAILVGLLVKTPLVPVHTWLPAAHVEAPAPVSAILAGVLLKLGTFGLVRVAYACMRETFAQLAPALGLLAVISVVYGALVALGQTHIKRRIAYTSITHMGYTVLGLAAFAWPAQLSASVRRLALSGAALEMVAHALITGALFLIVGSLAARGESFDMHAYGGLMRRTPRLTAAMVVAAFASLGLPGLAGFVAEFQIFSAALIARPWLAASALIGVLITAALFLQLLQVTFFGRAAEPERALRDLGPIEGASLAVLLGLSLWIGVAPSFVLELLDAGAGKLLGSG